MSRPSVTMRNIKTTNNPICQICNENPVSVTFEPCKKRVCRNCYNQNIKEILKEYKIPKCPFCSTQILYDQSMNSFLTQKQVRIYKKIIFGIEMQKAKLRSCSRTECPQGIVLYIVDQYEGKQKLRCMNCYQRYCPKCYNPEHIGTKCKLSQIIYMLETFGYTNCPRCEILIERSKGCQHMTCICKYQFCYFCEEDWKRHNQCDTQNCRRKGRIESLKEQNQQKNNSESISYGNSRPTVTFFLNNSNNQNNNRINQNNNSSTTNIRTKSLKDQSFGFMEYILPKIPQNSSNAQKLFAFAWIVFITIPLSIIYMVFILLYILIMWFIIMPIFALFSIYCKEVKRSNCDIRSNLVFGLFFVFLPIIIIVFLVFFWSQILKYQKRQFWIQFTLLEKGDVQVVFSSKKFTEYQ